VRDQLFQLQQLLPTLATKQSRAQIQLAKSNVSAGHVEASAVQPLVVRDQLFQLQQLLPTLATKQSRAQIQLAKSNVSVDHMERNQLFQLQQELPALGTQPIHRVQVQIPRPGEKEAKISTTCGVR
jgi:hypothetical protein